MTRSDARQNRLQIMQAFHDATRTEVIALPTMSDIVKLSGLGRGTVYRHFPDIGSLAFSFLTNGYETLFEESREKLKNVRNPSEAREALEDHLYRYRAFSKENLSVLLRTEALSSDGYELAYTSQRQVVRRALRDMAGIGKTSPHLLDAAVDIISRIAEPEHLKVVGVSVKTSDDMADEVIQMALDFADTVADGLGKVSQTPQ